MNKPLSNIRIVELADYVSAPVCARLLADLGAEVIKIERESGNVWRETGKASCPNKFTDEENPGYDINNTGKRHIVLNLKSAQGLAACHRLLETADVFVTNMRVQALKRLGLDYESLKDRYPRLIYAIGLGYGEKGPDANSPAFDHTAFWARTGFLLDMAPLTDDYHPVFPPSSVGDNFTGITLALEVCAALYNRLSTGKGDYVRSSLFHNGIFAMGAMQIATQGEDGSVFPRTRERHGVAYGDYKCADGVYVYIAAGYAEKLIEKVFSIIGREDLITDERFNSADARREHAEELYEIVCAAMLSRTSDEWLAFAKEADIPMVKMQHFSELSEDPQALENGYIQDVSYPGGTTYKIASSPIEMDSVGALFTEPTKQIGADTDAVLTALGYSEEELTDLKEKGVINR
ncbi:MAG: CoA transferase [Clostridia bacterium]|nr:CoA transferase [Clostridia bacterium]